MLGRPAIHPHAGIGGPPHGAVRHAGSGDTTGIVPVRPVRAVDGILPTLEALARAGVDVQTILESGADALVERTLPTATALTDLLERARSAIVRGAPGDALAALDEGWDGAARTEGGWYYRGAALALLGLPGEADRVLQQGLVRRGGSIALHFLTSIVRAIQGDSAGARDALAQAQARRPRDNVLVAWQAVLLARQGDQAGALQLLDPFLEAEPNSSVLSWARQAIRLAKTEFARASLAAQRRADPALIAPDAAPDPEWSLSEREPLAPLAVALRRLGAQFVGTPAAEARQDVRLLLQSLATGGALDRAARPDQSVATRSILVAMLGVLSRDSTDASSAHVMQPPPPRGAAPTSSASLDAQPDAAGRWRLTPAVPMATQSDELASRGTASVRHAVLLALRVGALSNAMAWLPRATSVEGEASAIVLRHLLTGARESAGPVSAAAPSGNAAPSAANSVTPDAVTPDAVTAESVKADSVKVPTRVPGRVDDALAVPIRIGLSLLQESSARVEATHAVGASSAGRERGFDSWVDGGRDIASSGQAAGALGMTLASPRAASIAGTPASGTAAAAPLRSADRDSEAEIEHDTSVVHARPDGFRLRLFALVCMALAFGALALGYGVVAIALAGGASWLALRSSAATAPVRQRERLDRAPHEPETAVADAPSPVTLRDAAR